MAVDTPATIAILGAGPIGIEVALYARFLGYDVQLYERGRVCENMLRWGHVQLFSPFAMNRSSLGLAALAAQAEGYQPPGDDELLTGRDLAERYFLPLANSDLLADCLFENTRVCHVGREGFLKHEAIGAADREESAFRLLLETASGEQRIAEADVVVDCTGTYGNSNWTGQDGIPALGETAAAAAGQIEYELPDVLGTQRQRYAGQHTLLVGSGYSAATSIVALAQLAQEASGTQVTWVTRRQQDGDSAGPIRRIEADRLRERDQLAQAANALTRNKGGAIRHLAGSQVATISSENDRLLVRLSSDMPSEFQVDRILALVGYRPDRTICQELQVHECYATEAPMKLAAAMLKQPSGDCLDQVPTGAATLSNPEAHYYVLGAKSHGRGSQFLISIGRQQIQELFTIIGDRHDLNLYHTVCL